MEKKFFIVSILTWIFSLLFWFGIVLYYDPAQQFKITKFPSGDERILNAGLAKNANYDTVILGSSTSQNILKKDVDNLFNSNSINLSLSGTTNFEQRKLLQLSLNKEIKRVIFGLDPFVFNRGYESSRVKLEKFAYENNKIEMYKYIYNFVTFKGIVKSILGKSKSEWIYNHGYWGNNYEYSKEQTLSFDKETQWGAQNIGVLNIFKEGYSLELMKKNFDTFYKMMEDNKNVEFLIYYPPYANLWWNYAQEYQSIEAILGFKEYIYSKITKLDNVKLYDFQNDKSIVENLDNYKDMVHFSPEISRKIIQDIKSGKNVIN